MVYLARNCDLCGSPVKSTAVVVAAGRFDRYGVSFDVHTVMCRYCKFVFQLERLDRETLTYLYTQDKGYDSPAGVKKTRTFVRNKRRRQETVTAAIELAGLFSRRELHVLDVGGGTGEITEHLVGSCNVYLADVNTSEPINPRIVRINKLFEDLEEERNFDVVVMNHVLEHAFSPTHFLKKAHILLNNGGIVFIEVPFELYTPVVFRRTGDWRHVAYFSRPVMYNFLWKAGFSPLSVTLCTGYYHTRRLTVIRAVAQKDTGKKDQNFSLASSYLALFRDCINVGALTHYLFSQLAKLSTWS